MLEKVFTYQVLSAVGIERAFSLMATADIKRPVTPQGIAGFLFLPRSTMLRVKLGEENSMGWGSFPKRHFSGAMGNRISKPPIDAKKQNGSDYISFKSNKQSMNNPMHLLTGVSSSGSFLLVGLFA